MTCRAICFGLLLEALSFSQTPTQPALPQCPPSGYWDHCWGTRRFSFGGAEYVGAFCNNEGCGQGTYTDSNGDKYVGEFRGGYLTGQGTVTYANGTKYVGEFRNFMFNGQGTLTYAEADTHVGEHPLDRFDGRGAFLVVNGKQGVNAGDSYAGDFRNKYADGQGTYTLANGDKYVGKFRNGTFNGLGTYTFANGTKQTGNFLNGKYEGPPTQFAPSPPTSEIRPPSAPIPAPTGTGMPLEVILDKRNGVLLVPVLINNALTLDFVLDSGAADVSIPADVVLTLIRTGTLTEADFSGTKTYVLADGSKVPSQTFRIRSLKVGNRILENVSGSVASVNGSLLLGQSFLNRFKSWSIDNARQVLLLQ